MKPSIVCGSFPLSFLIFRIQQVDANNAFLNGVNIEDVYIRQPEGFIDSTKPIPMCKLSKSLYRLCKALRAWYDLLKQTLYDSGFYNSKMDSSIFPLHHKLGVI